MNPAHYIFRGEVVSFDSKDFQGFLERIYRAKERPSCACKPGAGIECYISKVNGHYLVKRMPNTGEDHAPTCDSYEMPSELSGLGQVMGVAIQEDLAEGTTLLKLDFSLSKSGYRPAPVPSGKESDSVKSNGNKLTLRGTLHYLWDQAGFTRWSPGMENKRNWYVIRKFLLQGSESKTAKGFQLSDILYIPERFDVDHKDEIASRRQAHLMRIATSGKSTRQLMIVIAEVKELTKGRYGMKFILKHLPDFHFSIDEDLHRRFSKRFEAELSLWGAHELSHLILVGTFGVSGAGVATIEEVAVMLVNENWVPFDNAYEMMLLTSLTTQRRRFMKGLHYNLDSETPLASAVLMDTGPVPHALYIRPAAASDQYAEDLRALMSESKMESWLWDAAEGRMPILPPAENRDQQHKLGV